MDVTEGFQVDAGKPKRSIFDDVDWVHDGPVLLDMAEAKCVSKFMYYYLPELTASGATFRDQAHEHWISKWVVKAPGSRKPQDYLVTSWTTPAVAKAKVWVVRINEKDDVAAIGSLIRKIPGDFNLGSAGRLVGPKGGSFLNVLTLFWGKDRIPMKVKCYWHTGDYYFREWRYSWYSPFSNCWGGFLGRLPVWASWTGDAG